MPLAGCYAQDRERPLSGQQDAPEHDSDTQTTPYMLCSFTNYIKKKLWRMHHQVDFFLARARAFFFFKRLSLSKIFLKTCKQRTSKL